MPGIIVVGSLNMDLVITTPKVPVMGETILGNGFMTVPGGKGANQAVAAARLGGRVSMVGCVGNDIYGANLLDNLESSGVDVSNIKKLDGLTTGVAVIVVKDGDNFIIVNSGANWALKPEDMDSIEALIKDSSILMLQLETPPETVERVIDIARKYGVKVLLNPAPARELCDRILAGVDIFTPNESECGFYTGMEIKSIDDAKYATAMLYKKGIPSVVVTLGGKGVVYNIGEEIIHKPAPEVKAIDTTAAGDSFCAALAVALAQEKALNEAVDFASVVGTLTVMKKGAQASLPYLKDVEEFNAACP